MRKIQKVALGSVVLGIVACSSPTTEPQTPQPAPAPAAQSAASSGNKAAIFYFKGDVDVATSTVSLTFLTPEGKIIPQVGPGALPYGNGGNGVYFHTCAVPAVSYTIVGAGGHLDGLVQAVNNMGGTIPDLSVKMNSITDAGTTFSTSLGGGNLYGSVPRNVAPTCGANTATWTFTQTTTTNFSFYGEADGTAPQIITIGDATLGEDCLFAGYSPNTVTVGNDTAQLFAACNNQAAPCTVASINGLGDPAGGCQKDYRAHYSCNGAAVKEIFVCGSAPPNGGVDTEYPAIPGGYPAPHGTCEASGQSVTLTCP